MRDTHEIAAARDRVANAVAEIRAEIEKRSALAPELDRRGMENALAQSRRRATVTAHWGIAPSWPVFGRVEVLAKRTMRILLRWYINPIVEQQNEFNTSVLATLYEMEAQLEEISSIIKQDEVHITKNTAT